MKNSSIVKYNLHIFNEEYPDKDMMFLALEKAHEVRQFEIRLYWQRSLFFWGFILFFFYLYLELLKIDEQDAWVLLQTAGLTVIGQFTSAAWIFVEKGSRTWQQNWEYHIDFLENPITGSLHKSAIGRRKNFFSPAKVHKWFIRSIAVTWMLLSLISGIRIVNCVIDDPWKFIFSIHDFESKNLFYLVPIILLVGPALVSRHLANGAWKSGKNSIADEPREKFGAFDLYVRDIPGK